MTGFAKSVLCNAGPGRQKFGKLSNKACFKDLHSRSYVANYVQRRGTRKDVLLCFTGRKKKCLVAVFKFFLCRDACEQKMVKVLNNIFVHDLKVIYDH